jgi:hypothetical protein
MDTGMLPIMSLRMQKRSGELVWPILRGEELLMYCSYGWPSIVWIHKCKTLIWTGHLSRI